MSTFHGAEPLGKKRLESLLKGCANEKFEEHWLRGHRFSQRVCAQNPASELSSCVFLGQSLNLSELSVFAGGGCACKAQVARTAPGPLLVAVITRDSETRPRHLPSSGAGLGDAAAGPTNPDPQELRCHPRSSILRPQPGAATGGPLVDSGLRIRHVESQGPQRLRTRASGSRSELPSRFSTPGEEPKSKSHFLSAFQQRSCS